MRALLRSADRVDGGVTVWLFDKALKRYGARFELYDYGASSPRSGGLCFLSAINTRSADGEATPRGETDGGRYTLMCAAATALPDRKVGYVVCGGVRYTMERNETVSFGGVCYRRALVRRALDEH